MYIIMYKYSTFKINRKSFPNNIKNPIAAAQRKQSPSSPSSPTRPGILIEDFHGLPAKSLHLSCKCYISVIHL